MFSEIAHGEISVTLDDRATRELEKLDAEFEAFVKNVDRQKAEVDLSADVDHLKRDLKEAEAYLKAFRAKQAQADKDRIAAGKEMRRLAQERNKVANSEMGLSDEMARYYSEAIKAQKTIRKARIEELATLRKNVTLSEEATKNLSTQSRIAADTLATQKKATAEAQHQAKIEEAKLKSTRAKAKLVEAEIKLQEAARKRDAKALAAEIKLQEAARKRDAKALADAERAEKAAYNAQRQAAVEHSRPLKEDIRLTSEKLSLQSKMERQREKEMNSIPKMEQQYIRMRDALDGMVKARGRRGLTEKQTVILDLKIEEHSNMLDDLHKEIRRITGRNPVHFDVTPRLATRAGEALRREMYRNQTFAGVATGVGIQLGGLMASGLGKGFAKANVLRSMGAGGMFSSMKHEIAKGSKAAGIGAVGMIGKGFDKVGDMAGKLSDMTVRLGPFTSSIRGLGLALSVLGPVIVDIVGSLGALVGSVGAAAVGAGALGIALVGGAIPALGGLFAVMKPVVQKFSEINKASKAYSDAVDKHGKSSDQAKKKLKEFNNVMGSADKQTKAAFLSAGNLGKAWNKATAPGQAAGLRIIANGLTFAKKNMGSFATETNRGMGILEKSSKNFMDTLHVSAFERMGHNFNSFLRPAIAGVGHLTNYLAEVGRVASRSLPGVGKTFNKWTAGLLKGTGSQKFVDNVNKMIDSAKTLGRFLTSAGRLTVTFFGGGVNAGNKMLDTMTAAMNRWNTALKGPQSNKLGSFFNDSVAGTQSLYNALSPLVSMFAKWAIQIAPIARAFFDGTSAVAGFVHEIASISVLRGPITAIVTTLGALWAFNKIRTATTAVSAFTSALMGLSRAQGAVAATSAAGSIERTGVAAAAGAAGARRQMPAAGFASTPIIAPGAAANAERAAASTTRLARASNLAKMGLMGLGGAVTGFATVGAGLGTLVVGAAAGMYLWASRTREFTKQEQKAQKAGQALSQLLPAMKSGAIDLASSSLGAAQAERDVASAQKQSVEEGKTLSKMRKDGKKGTAEYNDLLAQHKDTLMSVRQAELSAAAAKQQTINMNRQEKATIQAALKAAHDQMSDRKKQVADLGKNKLSEEYATVAANAKKAGKSVKDYLATSETMTAHPKDKLVEYGDALAAQTRATKAYQHAVDMANLSEANRSRALRGLVPLADSAAKAISTVTRLGGKNLATKISLKYDDPGKAAAVAKKAGSALKAGVPKSVATRIVANSGSAESAMKRLQAAKLTPKKLTIIENGGKKAIATLEQIMGRKLTKKEQKIAEKGGANVLSLLRKLASAADDLPDPKIQVSQQGAQGVYSQVKRVSDALFGIKPKHVDVSASVSGTGDAHSLGDAIASVHDKSVTVTATAHKNGSFGGLFSFWATGGMPMSAANGQAMPPDQRKVQRAAGTAQLSGARKTQGGKYTQPTLLVGEESKTEYVIATNPKYRKRNQGFVRHAAKALGMDTLDGPVNDGGSKSAASGGITSAAGGASLRAKKTTTPPVPKLLPTTNTPDDHYAPDPLKGGGFFAGTTVAGFPALQTTRKRKGGTKKRPKYVEIPNITANAASAMSWFKKITGQQSDWDTELGIRQSQVREPKTMTMEDPTKPGSKIQVVNQTEVDKYQAQLQAVIDAYEKLKEITGAIVANTPEVKSRMEAEIADFGKDSKKGTKIGDRSRKIASEKKSLAQAQKDLEKKQSVKHKTTKTKSAITTLRDRISRLKKAISHDEGVRNDYIKTRDKDKEFVGSLSEARKKAGTDNRAYAESEYDVQDTFNGVPGGAAQQVSDANDQSSGSGGGSTPSMGEQSMAASVENYNTAKSYSGNAFAMSGAGQAGGPMQGSNSPLGGNPFARTSSAAGSLIGSLSGASRASSPSVGGDATGGYGSSSLGGISSGGDSVSSAIGAAVGSAMASSAITTGGAAANAVSQGAGGGGSAMQQAHTAAASGGGDKNITINNTFATVPPDPHTFVQGTAFEINAAL